MRVLNKFIKIVCGILIFILLLTLGFYIAQKIRVFGKTSTDIINPQTQTFEEIIELSDEITMEKKLFSFRKHYYILSDGVLIGEVKGKFFPIFGDTLQLKDIHGNLIKKESQIKRLGLTQVKLFNISINRLAKVEDANGDTTGYIGEEKQRDFWRLKRVQYFYDENHNKQGRAIPDAILFCKDYKIYDNENNVDYVIDGRFFSPTHRYNIEIRDKSDIDVEEAIFYTIIENSIISSKMKESSSSSNKSK
ncbi:hypothetical protein H8S10_14515 [Clostridium sp. NSJ-49]|uniref:Uncharacterized protein n=1 Tax=Clostridium disporicum TaxID=84024 RepID=A0A174KHG4_9CLOT|nr:MULTISPECIES: hypothetical protein [Clostridium]MBC5626663.1 hypothetical protein [Clostridium sp. NSJ-49]CUP11372.1 Uncharacterised protein [Clostridium disporicum]